MPKAEVGSVKHLNNQLRSRGLQRLRWWCELCRRQFRDDNGFKLHTQSEGHMRNALAAGKNFKQVQDDYSAGFLRDFLQLLRTGHGEKQIQVNRFYQEYIGNKTHVHLNATKWSSLTEFTKYLGRESLCRVEEKEDGLFIAWIDDSPEALRRKEAVRRKEMQDKGDEEREQMMLREQIRRARKDAADRGIALGDEEEEEEEQESRGLQMQDGDKVKLSFGIKAPPKAEQAEPSSSSAAKHSLEDAEKEKSDAAAGDNGTPGDGPSATSEKSPDKPVAKPVSVKFGAKPQPKNVFAQAKKNALGGSTKKSAFEQPKKMSEVERIMKEELERKRSREFSQSGSQSNKKQRT